MMLLDKITDYYRTTMGFAWIHTITTNKFTRQMGECVCVCGVNGL